MTAKPTSASSALSIQRDEGIRRYLAYFLILAAMTAGLLGYFLQNTYQQKEQAIGASSLNEAAVLADRLEASLRRIDASFAFIMKDIFQADGPETLSPRQQTHLEIGLTMLTREFPEILEFMVFDAKGSLVTGPLKGTVSISGQDYFRRIRQTPDTDTHFSETLPAKTTGVPTVVAHQAILGPRGEFRGVLLAPINLGYFGALFADLAVGQDGMVSIRRADDSRLVVRFPPVPDEINKEARQTPPFLMIQKGQTNGLTRYIGKSDGMDRLFAFHKAGTFPFYVLVGRGMAEQFATWRQMAVISTLLTVAGLALMGMFLFRIWRSKEAIRASGQRFRDLALTTADWIWEVDAEGRYTYVSEKAMGVLGYAPTQLIGRTPFDFMPEDEAARVGVIFADIAARKLPFRDLENICIHADGSLRTVLTNGVPILDDQGRLTGYRGTDKDVTEAMRISAALKESEHRYRALFDTAGDAILILDGKHIVDCNAKAHGLYGATREEIVGRSPLSLSPDVQPDGRESMATGMQMIGEAHRDGCRTFEWRHHRLDGTQFDAEVTLTPLTIGDQGLLQAIIRDVTERKRVEERMTIMTQAIEQSTNSIAITDAAMRVVYANNAFCQLADCTQGRLIGEPITMLGSGTTPESTLRELSAALAEGHPWSGELHNRRSDGSAGVDYCHIAPVRNLNGNVTHHIAIQDDITDKKKLALELDRHRHHLEELVDQRTAEAAAAETRMRAVIDSSADGIIELDGEGRIALVNPAASALLGYAPDDLLGRDAHAAIHYRRPDGTPYPASECTVFRSVAKGLVLREDGDVFWRADGSPLPVSVAVHPIIRNGHITGAVMSFTDATERQRAEQAREQARQEAERLARTKSEFLANMSHEIRTPLNGVLGLAKIGHRDSAAYPELQNTFGRILESGRLLLTIINDILDFSKIEAGKLAIESVPFRPGELAAEAVRSVAAMAAAKHLTLSCDPTPELPTALGDPTRISQVLLNLLSNAIKFTQQGQVRVVAAREGAELVFRVEDSGIGIGPDDMERLFDPFEQADSSTTRRFGGTGLGLTICRRLAALMHGRLTVQSAIGRGSAFALHIPLREAQLPADTPAIQPSEGLRRLAGLRILVAEDNEINRLVLADMLESEGVRPVLVENGRLAVERITADPSAFDAVLMDVQMPELDGLEATRRLRQLAPDLPIIGQTAHAMKEEHDRCLAAGMIATMTKPIDADVLVATLQQHTTPAPRALPPVDAARSTQPLIDWQALEQRYARRSAFITHLATLMIESHAQTPPHLRQLAADHDIPGIERVAHDLKGLAGNLCAPAMEAQATLALQAARAGDVASTDLALSLADDLERLLTVLRERLPAEA